MSRFYSIILAGGSGERLWPLSSKLRPKQLIPFVEQKSLLEQTLHRVSPLVSEDKHIFIVTNKSCCDKVKKMASPAIAILQEPVGRNTAPAITLACLQIAEKDPEAIVGVFPADHFIPDTKNFITNLESIFDFCSHKKKLALLGIKPTFAATGYGYIQFKQESKFENFPCFAIKRFNEKPDKDRAQEYLKRIDMLWNIGMFVAPVRVFLSEIKKWAPEVFDGVVAYREGKCAYSDIPAISIDYAVMEKSDNTVVFPTNMEWYDVGNLTTFLTLKNRFEGAGKTRIINIAARGNLECTKKKVVAFVGVDDVCVVETEDVIVVVNKQQAELVKNVLQELRKQSLVDVV